MINLGIGIGLRPEHYEEIFRTQPTIDWFEIISEIRKRGQILPRESLASKFLSLAEDDLRTSGAFIQAVKPLAGMGNGF
ncbi:MAG: DUF692 family multinuclear iron-containing protein [Chlamydiota bacterium]